MPIKVYVAEAEGIPEYGTTTTVGKRLVAVKFLLPEASEKEKWVWKRGARAICIHCVSPLQRASIEPSPPLSYPRHRDKHFTSRGATISGLREKRDFRLFGEQNGDLLNDEVPGDFGDQKHGSLARSSRWSFHSYSSD